MTTHEMKIKIQTGYVLGRESEGVLSFKGIPYAAPITGLNRWLPPQPPLAFDDVLDAGDYGQICLQDISMPPMKLFPKAARIFLKTTAENSGWEQGANCLNLNIWTTNRSTSDKRPVMVFIHGGGLSLGSSVSPFYDGTALAKKGVVFVTLNYRIGTMGFLAGDGLFEGDVLKGNRGFMDQVAALEWVKENIAQFGGDPNNVTVLGQSGGGTSVWALLASPKTEGLIHKAIIQSGPVNMISIEDQLKLTREVLKQLKIQEGDVNALASIPNKKITGMIMQKTLMKRGKSFGEMSLTKLPTTGAYGTEFLPDDILPALEMGKARDIDILIGSCRHDGRASAIANPLPKLRAIKMMNEFVGGMIAPTKEGRKEILEKYKSIMPEDSNYIINEQIQTDALYRMRALKAASIHSRTSASKTYVYQFNWESPVADGKLGAIHGLEIPFAFNNLKLSSELIGDISDIESAQPLATAMSDAWVTFARKGNPASDLLPDWPEYNEETRKTMFFDSNCKIVSDPDSEMRKVWAD
jgi:carboxylesterase type B